MLRILFHALAVLHLGPGIAFVLLALGCDGVEPALGGLCAGSAMRFFAAATLVGWVVLGGCQRCGGVAIEGDHRRGRHLENVPRYARCTITQPVCKGISDALFAARKANAGACIDYRQMH